jgi:hypothetical protein
LVEHAGEVRPRQSMAAIGHAYDSTSRTRGGATPSGSAQLPGNATAPGSQDRLVRIVFWLVALSLGAVQAWSGRNAMNADGISYLDIADAYMRADWHAAINGY